MRVCPVCRGVFEDDVSACPVHGSALVVEDLLPHKRDLEPGTMVGEYRIDRKLGSGTFGDVYAGEHPLIGKNVAVKVLHQRFATDPETVSRFIAEARAVNKIRHRNIIDIFSFNVLPGARHYFVMELLDGLTLGALLEREGRLSLQTTLQIAQGIASALDAAHEMFVIHRDLKPENVFLAQNRDGSYFPKLLDFGIAKLEGDDVGHSTNTGIVFGTPRYMSPEQARGKRVDFKADIYALGVIIHEMLTGKPPFTGDSTMEVLTKHDREPPPRMSSISPQIPAELDGCVLAMLAKRPADRPQSAGAAVAALAKRAAELGLAGTLPVATKLELVRRDESAQDIDERTRSSTEGISAEELAPTRRRSISLVWWASAGVGLVVIAFIAFLKMGSTAPNEGATSIASSSEAISRPTVTETAAPQVLEPSPSAAVSSANLVEALAVPSASTATPAGAARLAKPKVEPTSVPAVTTQKSPNHLDSILGERE